MATNTSPEAHVPCNTSTDRGQSMRAALRAPQSEVFSGVKDASRSRMALARRDCAIERRGQQRAAKRMAAMSQPHAYECQPSQSISCARYDHQWPSS